jgi:hypothetical protein
VRLHPGDAAGTKARVVGLSMIVDAPGGCGPSATDLSAFQLYVVVLSGPITLNVAVCGNFRHAEAVVTVPISTDQNPPGVLGWFDGNARIVTGVHDPVLQVSLVTSSVTRGTGDVDFDAEQPAAVSARRAALPRCEKRLRQISDISPPRLSLHPA